MTQTEKIVLPIALVLLCISIHTQFVIGQVAETELLLVNVRRLLDGGQLYKDVFTVQPPLIDWLYMMPMATARFFGLVDRPVLVFSGLMLVAASIAMCDRVLAIHPAFAANPRSRIWHAFLLCGVFIPATSSAHFFDREHVFLLLTLPYLLRLMPSLADAAMPVGLRLIIGCMAGLGFCIKPHCAIVFIVVQLLCIKRARSMAILWSLENIIIYAIAALYIASIFTFTPEYFRTVLPMELATYSAASQRIVGLMFIAYTLLVLGIAFADFRWRMTTPVRRDIYYLLGLCAACLLYGLANNGWGYTYSPLIDLALITTGWAWLDYLWLRKDAEAQGLPTQKFIFGLRACSVSLICIIGYSAIKGLFITTMYCADNLNCSDWGRQLVVQIKATDSFGTLSGDFSTWAQLSDTTGAHWDTRFESLWMVPKFLISGEDFRQRNGWILQYVADAFADDMERHVPSVMFVDNFDTLLLTKGHVDLVAYFSAFPRFREAWKHYVHTQSIVTCLYPERVHCAFEVYRRKP